MDTGHKLHRRLGVPYVHIQSTSSQQVGYYDRYYYTYYYTYYYRYYDRYYYRYYDR